MTAGVLRAARVVAGKELRDLARDPRTLFLSLALPLLLFPVLFWILAEVPAGGAGGAVLKIAVRADAGFPAGDAPPLRFVRLQPDSAEAVQPAEALIAGGRFDAVLTAAGSGGDRRYRVDYDNGNKASIAAYQALRVYLQNLEAPREAAEVGGAAVEAAALHPAETAAGKLLFSSLLPLLLFLFAVTCPLPIAADLSSGEKERGSLEPLLSTSAPRGGIVLGKLAATIVAGFASVCAFGAGLALSYALSPAILGPVKIAFPMGPADAIAACCLAFLITAIYAALELAAGIITRSVREAQLLGMPLLVVSMGAVYVAQSVDPRAVPALYLHVPLVNLALAVGEAARGEIRALHLAAALLWGIAYLAGAALLSRRMFDRESVVFRT